MPDSSKRSLVVDEKENCPPGTLGNLDSLGHLFALPDLNFPPDPQLSAAGWERRFMADPERVKEASILYHSLGYEVRVEPVGSSELSIWCHDCKILVCRSFKTIYTRKKV